MWVRDEVREGVGGEVAALRCVGLDIAMFLPSYIAFMNEGD